ncbi:MAG: hexose kinase [Clostridiales bacterium]|jgi:1-phosphofructokinase family hexose kinase|nr:hexose kinase [Clostridiales bacterium]
MINTFTLNPAIDRILYLNKLEKAVTNRIQHHTYTLGGKGTHVSMNLSQMGVANRAFGLARGDTGRRILRILEEQNICVRFVFREDGESRTNDIIIEDDHTCTTLAEKGEMLDETDFADLCSALSEHTLEEEFLVLSGDASNSPDPFLYNRIVEHLRTKRPKVFLDSSGDTLRKGLECSPFLIKPNQDELEALCGFSLESDSDVLRGIGTLDAFGIEAIVVSLGKRGIVARFGKDYYKATPPNVAVHNTAGCGDSLLAAILYGYEKGMSHIEMLKYATAVSSAKAASPLSVGFDRELAARLLDDSLVEQII